MSYDNHISDAIRNSKKVQEDYISQQNKHLESIQESIEMQKRQFSPIYNLIKSSENARLKMDMFIQIPYNDFLLVNQAYDAYKQDRENIQDSIRKLVPNNDVYLNSVESFNTIEKMRSPIPLDFLQNDIIPKKDYCAIYDELASVDWKNIVSSSIIPLIGNYPLIEFVTKNPGEFSLKLYNHVKDDENELSSVFTKDFLDEITQEWWILPRFSFEKYKELYDDFEKNGTLNMNLLFDFYSKPEHIYDLLDEWSFIDINREKIIMQAIDNYYIGNFEICVVTLLLQIEGLLRDKFQLNTRQSSELRKKLEKELTLLLETKSQISDFWEIFLIKSSKDYIWMILKPLCDEVDFIEESDEINRHISAHTGKVEANQKIAIRLILIIDTLMYLLDLIYFFLFKNFVSIIHRIQHCFK